MLNYVLYLYEGPTDKAFMKTYFTNISILPQNSFRRKNVLKISYFFLLIILLQGCECVVKPPCNGTFNFALRDKITKKDLIQGPSAIYALDSLRITEGNNPTQPPSSYPYNINKFSATQLQYFMNGISDTVYLKLNSMDTDTLLLSFTTYKSNLCCPSGSKGVIAIKFNGVKCKIDSGAFIFEK
jgi:hypothetical protein